MDNTASNEITGARIATKPSALFEANFDAIFRNKPNSNGLETANLVSENNLKDSQSGRKIT